MVVNEKYFLSYSDLSQDLTEINTRFYQDFGQAGIN